MRERDDNQGASSSAEAGTLVVFFTYYQRSLITSVKWAQEDGWLEIEECWWYYVQNWAECSRFLVQQTRIGRAVPPSSIQAMDKCLEGSQGLRRGEGTVAGAVNEHLAQQAVVPLNADNARICLLVLVGHKPIASCMHCEDRNTQVSIEDDVVAQVLHCLWISCDTRSSCEGAQVLIQIQSSLLVEGHYFTTVR